MLEQQILLEQSASVRSALSRLVRAYAATIADHGPRMSADGALRKQCERLTADIGAAAEAYARVLDMMGWPLEHACTMVLDAVREGGELSIHVETALRERAVQCARNVYRTSLNS